MRRFSLLLLTIRSIFFQRSLLGWGTGKSCLFPSNKAAFFVDMENSSVLSFSR